MWQVLKQTLSEFSEDECVTLAASLAYYAVFSLPPLLVLLILLAGTVFDPADVRGQIESQVRDFVGAEGVSQARTMIQNAREAATGRGLLPQVLGIALLTIGATGAFVQLQHALNRVWRVQPDPHGRFWVQFIFKRLLSFLMVIGIAILLGLLLVGTAALAFLSGYLEQYLPAPLGTYLLLLADPLISLAVVILLFAAIFKVLPDAVIHWRDVWVGAAVTALLFVAGKFAIGFYLGSSNPGGAFGASAALALILVWVYYSSLILLLGAEFTKLWARHYGTRIQPTGGAVRVVRHAPEKIERPEELHAH